MQPGRESESLVGEATGYFAVIFTSIRTEVDDG